MGIKKFLETVGKSVKARADYYARVIRHPETPWIAKALLWMALAYALSPIDIVPDFIPIIGHLDDLVIVPALILLALWLVPERVKLQCKEESEKSD